MTEKVIVRQNNQFEISFRASDPQDESPEVFPINHIHELSPYGMMLASLGSCTTIVLHTYAQNHGLNLEEVEISEEYERVFKEDCEDCENIDRYEEYIHEEIQFFGDFSPEVRDKLFHIAHQCSIHKMFESGIQIQSKMAQPE
jgi:uncharacterized OsmC-like protein